MPYMWNNFLHMATKGSFVSEQAMVGSELICQDEFLVQSCSVYATSGKENANL